MKLYVDDIRDAPDESWTLVRTITEAIRCIAFFKNDITEISLDHDIFAEVRINGVCRPFPTAETLQPVAYFIGEAYGTQLAEEETERNFPQPKITIHSSNPVGAESMEYALGRYGIGCEIKPMGEAYRPK